MKSLLLILGVSILASSCANMDRSSPTLRKDVNDVSVLQGPVDGYRRRIVVMPFLDSSPKRTAGLKEKAYRSFIQELSRSKDLIVVAGDVAPANAAQLLSDDGYNLKELCKEAAGKGFPLVLDGKLIDVKIKRKSDKVGIIRQVATQFEIISQMRVTSTRGCKEVFNTVKTVSFDEQGVRVAESAADDKLFAENRDLVEILIKDAFLEYVSQVDSVLKKVAFEGRIASVSGERMYLNVGKTSGIQVGDILRVLEPGDDVYDPESGLHLGKVNGRLKGTIEVIGYFGSDGAIAAVHSGAGFKENDRVESY